jgi:hypothetical protein
MQKMANGVHAQAGLINVPQATVKMTMYSNHMNHGHSLRQSFNRHGDSVSFSKRPLGGGAER